MFDISVITSVVIAIAEMAKKLGLSTKFIPILNLILSITILFFYGSNTIEENIFTGILVGLSASGLYSGVKTVSKKNK